MDRPPILRFLFLFACLMATALGLAILSETGEAKAATASVQPTHNASTVPDSGTFGSK